MAFSFFYAALLIGILPAVASTTTIESVPAPNIGDVEFSQLLVLLSQYLTEVRHDVLELKSILNDTKFRISRLETELQQLSEDSRKNFTSIDKELSKITTSVEGVAESVELVSTNFSSQLSGVLTTVTSLQSSVDSVINRVSVLESTSVTDIKLGNLETSPTWEGPGYTDQYSYVLTHAENYNSDAFLDIVGRRQLLKKVAGSWVNIG